MKSFSYMANKMRDVKAGDVLALIPMILAKVSSPLFRRYNSVWLICEDASEARDNGYWFFKHMTEHHKERKCVYAIKKSSPDYEKVAKLGEIVQFGSLKHWIMYFNCEYNISSQKGGKPNAAVCAFLELNGLSKVKNVFLQHGVTINNARWLYSDRSDFTYFITATTDETRFIIENFGYDKSTIQLTGFSRFDNLHNQKTDSNRILIMPSWRAWFSEKTAQNSKADADFASSDYLRYWKSLLASEDLNRLIDKHELEIVFYPHRNMQKYLSYFEDINSKVKIASVKDYDVQELLKSSRLLITDYSSVFFDMIYMRKPIIFFQFDEEKFRRQQYQQGYFDYHNNPFGETVDSTKRVVDVLEKNIENDYNVTSAYLEEHARLFPYFDTDNSERIFALLSNRENMKK